MRAFGYAQTLTKVNITWYQRSLLAQLKFCILPLKIETDRYIGIAMDKRLCRACAIKEPEDDLLFLFKCPSLNDTRMSAWHSVYGSTGVIDINSNDPIDTVKTMLSVEHIQATGKFVEFLYKTKRQKILYNWHCWTYQSSLLYICWRAGIHHGDHGRPGVTQRHGACAH